MTALPPILARWARELAGLPPPLVAILAPWLGRLAIAIGPLPGDRRADRGELDGVDGLARRGSYVRLLISEWAIADELPDEFLRRAASGEHLFVAPGHRAPPRQRRSVVLLAAGPSQLGAPRLVHVAALIVLARRAAAGGAELAWGVLERPETGLSAEVDAAAIARLLNARTATVAGAAHVEAWRAALGADDRWLIGGDDHAVRADQLGATMLVVRDPLDPGHAALEVDVRDPDSLRPRAQLRLALPPADAAARLIREPLGRTAPPRSLRLEGAVRSMWFVQGGRRLAVELADRIELWPLPSSPREQPGRPRVWRVPAGETVIAFGGRKRTPLAVTWLDAAQESVRIHDVAAATVHTVRLPASVFDSLEYPEVAEGHGIGFAAQVKLSGESRVVFAGPTGSLLMAREESGRGLQLSAVGSHFLVGGNVLDKCCVAFIEASHDAVSMVMLDERGTRVPVRRTRPSHVGVGRDHGVRVGIGVNAGRPWPPFAMRVDGDRWDIVAPGWSPTVIASETPVYGAVIDGGDARLVCGDDDGRGVVLRGRDDRVVLGRAGDPVIEAICGTSASVVAWRTDDEIVVYSLAQRGAVLRIAVGAT